MGTENPTGGIDEDTMTTIGAIEETAAGAQGGGDMAMLWMWATARGAEHVARKPMLTGGVAAEMSRREEATDAGVGAEAGEGMIEDGAGAEIGTIAGGRGVRIDKLRYLLPLCNWL